MPCALPDDLPWPAFLAAREALADGARTLGLILRDSWSCVREPQAVPTDARAALLVEAEDGGLDAGLAATADGVCRLDARGLLEVRQRAGAALDPSLVTAARIYLPVLLGAAHARRAGGSFVVGHVTQTLDGRIACENGQSQWIGNDADLHHSHRMRALLDGVMVGANTALHDDPQLNVRHVRGGDPRRVVISGRGRALTEGAHLKVMQAPGCELFVGDRVAATAAPEDVQVHGIPSTEGALDPRAILETLQGRGVHSVYLEGGAGVLSSFLQSGAIDILQIHVASLLLGSGLPSFALPAVEHVDDGMRMEMDHAILDGHVLLTCRRRT